MSHVIPCKIIRGITRNLLGKIRMRFSHGIPWHINRDRYSFCRIALAYGLLDVIQRRRLTYPATLHRSWQNIFLRRVQWRRKLVKSEEAQRSEAEWPQTATTSNEISSFRQSRNKLNMFHLFWLCRKDKISFDIVAENGNVVAKNRNNVEATFDIVERIVQLVAFDSVAGTLLVVWTGLLQCCLLLRHCCWYGRGLSCKLSGVRGKAPTEIDFLKFLIPQKASNWGLTASDGKNSEKARSVVWILVLKSEEARASVPQRLRRLWARVIQLLLSFFRLKKSHTNRLIVMTGMKVRWKFSAIEFRKVM